MTVAGVPLVIIIHLERGNVNSFGARKILPREVRVCHRLAGIKNPKQGIIDSLAATVFFGRYIILRPKNSSFSPRRSQRCRSPEIVCRFQVRIGCFSPRGARNFLRPHPRLSALPSPRRGRAKNVGASPRPMVEMVFFFVTFNIRRSRIYHSAQSAVFFPRKRGLADEFRCREM